MQGARTARPPSLIAVGSIGLSYRINQRSKLASIAQVHDNELNRNCPERSKVKNTQPKDA